MKKLLIILFVLCFAFPAFARVRICSYGNNVGRCGHWFNLNIDAGYGGNLMRQSGMLRLKTGWLGVSEPWYISAGPSISLYHSMPLTVGMQAEVMHLSTGGWLQLEGFVDVEKDVGGMIGLGWSLVGVEFQTRKNHMWTVFGKLRIPVGILVLMFSNLR